MSEEERKDFLCSSVMRIDMKRGKDYCRDIYLSNNLGDYSFTMH